MSILVNKRIVISCFLLVIIFIGCSNAKRLNSIHINIPKSKNVVAISNEVFEKLQIEYFSGFAYSGFGKFNSVSGRINNLIPEFDKILYDPADSTLYIHGFIFSDTLSKRIYPNAQIIVGKSKGNLNNSYEQSINIYANYLIGENGEFSFVVKINQFCQIYFTAREEYDDKGYYQNTPLYYVKAYDIYELNKIHTKDNTCNH